MPLSFLIVFSVTKIWMRATSIRFYQVEGVYVSRRVNVGNLIATLQEFLQEYYGKKLDVRVNPFYFPFTEPSFEFALSCPFCEGKNPDCKVCSGEGWIELLGCGMIHPNVLRAAQIDPNEYTGFALVAESTAWL